MIGRIIIEYDNLAFEGGKKTYIAIVKDAHIDPSLGGLFCGKVIFDNETKSNKVNTLVHFYEDCYEELSKEEYPEYFL